MTLRFEGDAICLSGLTGTKLKCDVIGEYYPFWWGITSGGPNKEYRFPTALVELNAATGEVYIEDNGETVLGSAGHALELKEKNWPDTSSLKVVLVEEDAQCYAHLRRTIKRRWPGIPLNMAEGAIGANSSNVYLLENKLDPALAKISEIQLGNSLFFFDPLRSVEYSTINEVARRRMDTPFETGTEFFVFVFTSDWFLGRDTFTPLPTSINKAMWTRGEKRTVAEADRLFGNLRWRRRVLTNDPIEKREKRLISSYKKRLHRWFRYVLPLPFNPKKDQIFHLILCSNFETGIRMTKNAYADKTGNPRYSPNNEEAYETFRRTHPETLRDLRSGRKRPLQWLILWRIITQHENGVCDYKCQDLKTIEPSSLRRTDALRWLSSKGYLKPFNVADAWNSSLPRYRLDWKVLKTNLGVDSPKPLTPISPAQFRAKVLKRE